MALSLCSCFHVYVVLVNVLIRFKHYVGGKLRSRRCRDGQATVSTKAGVGETSLAF